MLLLLCCLGALATCGLGFSSKDKEKLELLDKDIEHGKPLDETFASFKAIFHKKYKDDKEHTKRKKIFEDNTKLIKDINKKHAKGKLTYYAGVNEFADLTQEEFLSHYQGFRPIDTTSARNDSMLFRRRRSLQTTVDWRNQGLVTDVKYQGYCGSCWVFSATGAIEGQYKKTRGELIAFSEQQILDCAQGAGCDSTYRYCYPGDGCNGGWMETAFDYVSVYGLAAASDYPYIEMTSTCKHDLMLAKAYLNGHVFIPKYDEEALAYAVAEVGPVSVAVDASNFSFHVYKGGVYNEPNCNPNKLTHAILVVGYGTSNDKDYWLVKNSWGISWGMEGYMQMSRNQNNQCGIATHAVYPLVE